MGNLLSGTVTHIDLTAGCAIAAFHLANTGDERSRWTLLEETRITINGREVGIRGFAVWFASARYPVQVEAMANRAWAVEVEEARFTGRAEDGE